VTILIVLMWIQAILGPSALYVLFAERGSQEFFSA
jgi:hypothetical protein